MRRRAICPACWKPVEPTIRGNIGWHRDKAGRPCETEGYPYRITERVA